MFYNYVALLPFEQVKKPEDTKIEKNKDESEHQEDLQVTTGMSRSESSILSRSWSIIRAQTRKSS